MRLLLLLTAIASVNSIEVKLAGVVYFDGPYVQGAFTATGREVLTLTDDNQRVFDITEEALKTAIETHHGKKPDNIYLTGESPWGDLYKKYGWSPVEIAIACRSPTEITHMSTENVVLKTNIYENLHTKMEEIKILESQETRDTVTTLWDMKGKNISAGDVEISLDFKTASEDEIARLSQVFAFGSNSRISVKTTRFQGAFIDLVPGQKVLAKLEAKKATMRFKIPYTASISGMVAAHYNETYRGHYFFGLPIEQLLEASYNQPKVTVEQWLTYEFYYGVNLNIIEAADGHTVLMSLAADAIRSGRRKASVAMDAAKKGKKIMIHPMKMPFQLSEEELKAIEIEIKIEIQLDDESDEDSDESTEVQTTERTIEVQTTERTIDVQTTEQTSTKRSGNPSSVVPKTE